MPNNEQPVILKDDGLLHVRRSSMKNGFLAMGVWRGTALRLLKDVNSKLKRCMQRRIDLLVANEKEPSP